MDEGLVGPDDLRLFTWAETGAEAWQKISKLAEGSYVAIGQTGDMQVVTTPMDAELAKLNSEIGTTVVAYGRREARAATTPTGVTMLAVTLVVPASMESTPMSGGYWSTAR